MNKHIPSAFASSPLITPERLARSVPEALALAPPWVIVHELADPELGPSEFKAAVRVGDKHPDEYSLASVSLAILFEVTRYGNSVTTNTNKRAGSKAAIIYLKIIYAGASKDNTPVSRLIMDARPHQAVRTNAEQPRELHPDGLTEEGAGKPRKDARANAMKHAEARAREHGCGEAEVKAYLDNLNALFAYHDGLFGIAPL